MGLIIALFIVSFFRLIIHFELSKERSAYQSYYLYLEASPYNIVELPFSVIKPLIDNNSSIIKYDAKRIEITKKEKEYPYFPRTYCIKLSKQDYKTYYNYITHKEEVAKKIKNAETILELTQLIKKELDSINDEALRTVEQEKTKIAIILDNLKNEKQTLDACSILCDYLEKMRIGE